MKAVVIGAGGHGQVVAEAAIGSGSYEVVGLLDADPALAGSLVLGIPVLGAPALLPDLPSRGISHALVGVGGVGDNSERLRVFQQILDSPLEAGVVIHPSATVSPSARLGPGTVVCASASVCAGAIVGANVIVNTGAVVDHHCSVGDHVHISPQAALAGGVRVAEMAHIGIGACLIQNVAVGAGAVVIEDVDANAVVAGNPARRIR